IAAPGLQITVVHQACDDVENLLAGCGVIPPASNRVQVISTAVLSELYIIFSVFRSAPHALSKGLTWVHRKPYGRLWWMELRAPAQIRNVSPGATLRSRRRERRTTHRNRATTPGHLDSES